MWRQDDSLAAALGVDQFEEADEKCPWNLGCDFPLIH